MNDEVQQGEPHRSDASSASGVSREVAPGAGSLGDGERRPGELNESQKRRLSITCEYIDKLLRDAEHILHAEASQSPFRRYLVDVNPVQVRVLHSPPARSAVAGACVAATAAEAPRDPGHASRADQP